MNDAAGITLLCVGGVLVVASTATRGRIGVTAWTIAVAAGGAALGSGGLALQHGVPAAAWGLTPLVMGGLSVAHVRALFAGAGPFRT